MYILLFSVSISPDKALKFNIQYSCMKINSLFIYTGGAPNYYPNSFSGPVDDIQYVEKPFLASGDVQRYNTEDTDNYSQVETFWLKVSHINIKRYIKKMKTMTLKY